jgi:deazaflavin-dependent oxidoreductase (nitroreductase family)
MRMTFATKGATITLDAIGFPSHNKAARELRHSSGLGVAAMSPTQTDHKLRSTPELRPAKPLLPPRWFIRLAWSVHRRLYRWTGGRRGLWQPKPDGWGAMRVTTIGRRTGQAHAVILGYFEDGLNLVTLAMNGWGDAEPAWWLNLQAHPEVTVDLVGGPCQVIGRAAEGDERERLWARWREINKKLDAYAARRSMQTAVVVLEPRRHRH